MVIVALDVGERRVGVAVSDPSGTLATPYGVIERRSRAEDFAAVAQLMTAVGAERLVVGLPLSLDGRPGPQARRVTRYARAMAAALAVPLDLEDERYSTVTADELLMEVDRPANYDRRGRRGRTSIDAAAAAVILQGYLDRRRDRGDVSRQTGADQRQE